MMGAAYAYRSGADTLVGYRARPKIPNGAGLLIAPAFAGLRDFEMAQAEAWAARDYEVLAVDYYGDGWWTDRAEAAWARLQEVQADRATFCARMQAVEAEVRGGPRRVGAFGFSLGGKAVLDLARSGGADAVASLHGLYDPPGTPNYRMPPVLLCHGWDDPLATPEQFAEMTRELDAHCDDWHALTSGGTGHAFTNPGSQADGQPNADYAARSAQRAWAATERFLAEHLRG
ncbi:hypothetical protein JANAI62_15380 [Jannaschia pagri]|uniref:Dienelactone hydrolase domain-containing protein n=1 Tax=Jannaschia pagri TaxID=2829797 RepID=A0ABQ4NKH0_9RHOB|nr:MULTISPECIES: dienelactone hydrolase family protein [unclassified Jannaschia]GIT91083.1 hypothetical protein JANAI61_15410 [Jannaschia sp. AI_61]GIT94915.1 hypothetical protein JANAI62_15380 [Jannaschia sp. AI_62]